VTRVLRLAAAALVVLVATACGTAPPPTEPPLPPLPQDGSASALPAGGSGAASTIRIVVVTHGQASDPFWAVVRRGMDDAARQADVSVTYEAPDSYDLARMRGLIEAAVASHPAGLVVSLPDPAGLAGAIERARAAGIPVVSINSGSDAFRSLGIRLHVGQAEYAAGFAVGKRLGRDGVRRALCVIHEAGNQALAERCRGIANALARSHGTTRELTVDLQNTSGADHAIAAALRARRFDALVTLGGATIAGPALAAIDADHLRGKILYATFGLGPDVLRALREGRLRFAVDQQPYLQGYLPIVLLAQYRRYGLMPADGTLIPTGPVFVTKANAAAVLDLVARGVR
jgi:simple sugar transport system substrate-binding protein